MNNKNSKNNTWYRYYFLINVYTYQFDSLNSLYSMKLIDNY